MLGTLQSRHASLKAVPGRVPRPRVFESLEEAERSEVQQRWSLRIFHVRWRETHTMNSYSKQQQPISKSSFTRMSICTQFIHQLPAGLLAQLVERCTGIAEVMGSNPVRAWNFFQVLLTTTSFSSVLSCEDLLISTTTCFVAQSSWQLRLKICIDLPKITQMDKHTGSLKENKRAPC